MLLEHSRTTHRHHAFTLIEMIVVVLLITLFLAILTPTLRAARSKSKTEVCLTHLKSLGNAIRLYAETYDTLPGPAHPAIYQNQSLDVYLQQGYTEYQAQYMLRSQFSYLLGTVQDSKTVAQSITCPTLAGIVPDVSFEQFEENTGTWVPPTHYCLNNMYELSDTSDRRLTNPSAYFGAPTVSASTPAPSPCRFAQIPNADREWAIADAWYRPRTNAGLPFLQQEGPYQWAYSGLAMPNFAPHLRRAGTSYNYTTRDNREAQSSIIRQQKSDGVTNTLFFDGHAAPIASRTAILAGFELIYGFPGTVNPDLTPQEQNYWDRIVWR